MTNLDTFLQKIDVPLLEEMKEYVRRHPLPPFGIAYSNSSRPPICLIEDLKWIICLKENEERLMNDKNGANKRGIIKELSKQDYKRSTSTLDERFRKQYHKLNSQKIKKALNSGANFNFQDSKKSIIEENDRIFGSNKKELKEEHF
jgi:hypothetical protein